MSPQQVPHWADWLTLRPEVRAADGSVGDLQMSLHKAVYQTVDVPYRKVDYYTDITEPTPNLIGFFGRVTRRLGGGGEATALFHLDQGMGGGKSHALVGLYHLANSPDEFFSTTLGQTIRNEAEHGGADIDLTGTRVVALTADYFSPGARNEVFGPATNLFERFIWGLVAADMDRYQHYVAMGPNKATLQQALMDTARPVLILLDELMDYALQLSDAKHVASMPSEKAFLNALMDACDDVPRVAFVVVMIRSEFDERGYPFQATEFREYIASRLVRNGRTAAVTEPQDFASIIRRRLFEQQHDTLPTKALAEAFTKAVDKQWKDSVFDRLGAQRGTLGFADRVEAVYPFHPELMRLVREEWAQVQGFQRVRSTVAIFARTALHWVTEHKAGRWAPALIGTGDIPLAVVLEQVLSSGLLLGNDRAVQGYRAVASTDITSTDTSGGRAVNVDRALRDSGVDAGQPTPAVRMATALFAYSLVGRAQGRRGATKAELLSCIFEPTGTSFTAAEEVFNTLTREEGLGALEITTPANAAARYYLSIKQTLRMYFTAAAAQVSSDAREELVWTVSQALSSKGKGPFDDVLHIERPEKVDAPLSQIFAGVDSNTTNRLVVLDPRRWTLLNGKDSATREEIKALLGQGPNSLTVDNAASCVVASVNTQLRKNAYQRAREVLAWRYVIHQIDDDTDGELTDAKAKLATAETKLRADVTKAFQHYAYLIRVGDELVVEFKRFDSDSLTSLRGDQVWTQLVADGRATTSGKLSATYLAALLTTFDRALTPREVVQSFYKNPGFPLVPSTDEIRRAMFSLINDDWELVDAEGSPLALSSPGQIQINSISQTLRPRQHDTNADETETVAEDEDEDQDDDGLFGGAVPGNKRRATGKPAPGKSKDSGGQPATDEQVGPKTYKRYTVEITNRSITAPETREQIWQLLKELSKVVDPANSDRDHQLLNLTLTLTTAEGDQGALESKATQIGAKVRVEDDDF